MTERIHRAFVLCAGFAVVGLAAALGCAAHPPPRLSQATTPEAAGLVDIRTRIPDLSIDMRYAGRDNFVGRPVAGYDAPRCLLLADVADALARVEAELRAAHLRLQVFDCYRPVRAVRDFVAWAGDLDDQRSKPRFYPNLDKRRLLGDYIAENSGHSRGATLDLTLLACDGSGACTPLDMGTEFDFFDQRANTESPLVDSAQRANRHRLRESMARHGFENYPLEWWHYTFRPEPVPLQAFDVPIR